jgi:parallel beta-helix repeat protein
MLINTSGTVIDLGGKTLKENILVQGNVSGVVIRNGTVKGEIRFRAVNYKKVLEEHNKTKNWTEEVRKVAPDGAVLRNLTIDSDGSTHQLYCGPGAQRVRVIDCQFKGRSKGPSVYFSMEGGNHELKRCLFSAETGARREVVAIDGSAGNIIEDCDFLLCRQGGIYIYRNSGENGVIRHQKPQFNMIQANRFDLTHMWLMASFLDTEVPHGIILGSRQGSRTRHNDLDKGYPWGSSDSDMDYARNNIVVGNSFKGDWFGRWIWDRDKNNVLAENKKW